MARRTRKGGGNFANKWKKAAEERGEGFGDPVPLDPGTYEMQLCKATIDDYGSSRKVMLKFVVLSPEDSSGAVCTYWEGVEDDARLVWLQRLMIALGIDLDEVEIEEESDILAAFDGVIEEGCACRVRVIEKDGFTNMRVLKAIEVDDLFDPEEALKGGGSSSRKSSDKEEEDEGEEDDAITKEDLKVGMQVEVETGPDETTDAEITSLPPKGRKVQVRFENHDEEDVELIDIGDVVSVYEDEEEPEDGQDEESEEEDEKKDDDEEADDEDGDLKIEPGDFVTFKQGRKKVEAEVVSVDDDDETAMVKIGGKGRAIEKDLEDLELVLED